MADENKSTESGKRSGDEKADGSGRRRYFRRRKRSSPENAKDEKRQRTRRGRSDGEKPDGRGSEGRQSRSGQSGSRQSENRPSSSRQSGNRQSDRRRSERRQSGDREPSNRRASSRSTEGRSPSRRREEDKGRRLRRRTSARRRLGRSEERTDGDVTIGQSNVAEEQDPNQRASRSDSDRRRRTGRFDRQERARSNRRTRRRRAEGHEQQNQERPTDVHMVYESTVETIKHEYEPPQAVFVYTHISRPSLHGMSDYRSEHFSRGGRTLDDFAIDLSPILDDEGNIRSVGAMGKQNDSETNPFAEGGWEEDDYED